MKNKNNKNPEVEVQALDGLSTIRDILMGQYITEFKATFEAQEKRMAGSGKDFSDALKALEDKLDKRIDVLEHSMTQKFDKLEKLLNENVDKLNNRIDSVSDADKKNLASMLASLSQNLAKGDL